MTRRAPVAEQHLLNDQTGFDGLPETHVVGDKEVDAGHRQRADYRLEFAARIAAPVVTRFGARPG